ncbi:MAG: hypothetical protein Q4C89_10185 [Deinococcus sp.]|uniref:hypothetical protein n=1 Tax=Deinococcus sp. TaxID=47478 RepID=UPI0026DD8CD3|nr:hypothetical protein [Deinococcus sp.]MDO4246380.1 hypothetical protein [Deinococcus sp.]
MNLDQRISLRKMPREELEAYQRLILQRERQIKRIQRRAELQAREGLDFWTWAALEEAPEQDRRHFFEARAYAIGKDELQRLEADIAALKEARQGPLARFAFQEECPCAFSPLLACALERHPDRDLLNDLPQFFTVRGVAEYARERTLARRALPERVSDTRQAVKMLLLREVGEVRGEYYHRFSFQNPAHPTR